MVPSLPGLTEAGYVTSDTVWDLRELPRRLVVLGGGPIGCELAQAFARLGSKVTLVEAAPRLLTREDPEVSALLQQRFAAEGIDVRTGCEALRASATPGGRGLHVRHDGREAALPFDVLLLALGRVANTEGYGLEALGIGSSNGHAIETDVFLQTRYPNIYACGDVAGPVSVHAHGVAPGVVRRGQRAVRLAAALQGRLPRRAMGHVHRPASGARRPERGGGEARWHALHGVHLSSRRPGPRDRRQRDARVREGADPPRHRRDSGRHLRRRHTPPKSSPSSCWR